MKIATRTQASPLLQAQETLGRLRRRRNLGVRLPPLMLLFAALALVLSNVYLFHNAFLSLFLGIIFAVFVAGQVLAWIQIRGMRPILASAEGTLAALAEAGEEPDLKALQSRLRNDVTPGPIRDLMLRWLDLGLRGEREGYDALMEEMLERRTIDDGRVLSLHATLNRSTLKLGFLGTLIGIILTFPPMKRAVLGLSDSDGELRFIRDIALAIDGDQYAILSTLVATAMSILVEFVTIQILEGLFLDFDLVQSRINEWNITTLQPAIARRREGAERVDELEINRARLEQSLLAAQRILENHLVELTTATRSANRQLAEVARTQLLVEERIARLNEYEEQYRNFLAIKRRAVSPESAQGAP